jgi:hypothetical protein
MRQVLLKYWLHLALVIIAANFAAVAVFRYFTAAQTCYTRDQVLAGGGECLVIYKDKVYSPPLVDGFHHGNTICSQDVTSGVPATHVDNYSDYIKNIFYKGDICAAIPTPTQTPIPPTPTDIPQPTPTQIPQPTPTTIPTINPGQNPTATTTPTTAPTTTTALNQPTSTPKPTPTSSPTTSQQTAATRVPLSPTTLPPSPTSKPTPTNQKPTAKSNLRNVLALSTTVLTYFGLGLVVITFVAWIATRKKKPHPAPKPPASPQSHQVDHIFTVTPLSLTEVWLTDGTDKIKGVLGKNQPIIGKAKVTGEIKMDAHNTPYLEIASITPLAP